MRNPDWTVDEYYLALDLMFAECNNPGAFIPASEKIRQLSALMNKLPIHRDDKKGETFRNDNGISFQINKFYGYYRKNPNATKIGKLCIYLMENKTQDEIHAVAEAIKRNADYIATIGFGEIGETYEFPEGSILGHLHRYIENRDAKKKPENEICAVCHDDMRKKYAKFESLLQPHLCVNITEINAEKNYKPSDFIWVCPNCHSALHQFRPWLSNYVDRLQLINDEYRVRK